MFLHTFGRSWISLPLFDIEGGGPGGGDAGGVGNGSAGSGSVGTPGGATAEPSVIDVDENALIRIKGQDKPIKFGDYGRNYQSQWTRVSQENARIKQQLQEYQRKVQAYEQSQRAPQGHVQSGTNDVLNKLKELPYLTGEAAVDVVTSIGDQIKQRDMVLLSALKEMQRLQGIVNGLHSTHQSNSFESKINNWLKEGGYPEEAKDLAKEIYLAYEGDDLDQEFPQIFRSRWEQLNKIIEAQRQAQVANARRNRFVPGRGGDIKPSSPLQFKGNEDPRAVAEALWDSLQESDT